MKTITILASVDIPDGETIGAEILHALSILSRPIAKKAVLAITKVNDVVQIESVGKNIGQISLYSVENIEKPIEANTPLTSAVKAKETPLATIVDIKANTVLAEDFYDQNPSNSL